jgi:XTP/dITP diphosphohydrolase
VSGEPRRPSLLVATRSHHKLREIRQLLPPSIAADLLDLNTAGLPSDPAEDALERFASFEENAAAKARYFAQRTALLTLADDSGLCVEALDGAPGVHSKRFSGRDDLSGVELDATNNRLLLERLRGVPTDRRGAHYVCVVALATPGGDLSLHRGTCSGVILPAPRGQGGFGYDPLFFLPSANATFGELTPERKNQLSHRGRAVRAAEAEIRTTLDRFARLR